MANKSNILIVLEQFRSAHHLAKDDPYDDIVAASLSYVEEDYLNHYLKIAAINKADLSSETRGRILQSFYRQVLDRLLKRSSSFVLGDTSLEQTREVHYAVEDEVEQLHRCKRLLDALAVNDDHVPVPAKPSDMLHEVLESVVDTTHHSIKLSSHVLELASSHAAHAVTRHATEISAATSSLQTVGLVMQGINFLIIPASYIYYAAKREPVPFNTSNNTKWALSGVGFALALVGVLVPPAGVVILFTMAAIGLVASIAGFAAHIYERVQTRNKSAEAKDLVASYRQKIAVCQQKALELKQRILQHRADPYHDQRALDEDQAELKALHEVYASQQFDLKKAQVDHYQLSAKVQQSHTNGQTLNTGFQVVLACAVIAGAVLMVTPFTAPVGLTLLIVAGALGMASLILGKLNQIRLHRQPVSLSADKPVIKHSTTVQVAEILDPEHPREEIQNTLKHKPRSVNALPYGPDKKSEVKLVKQEPDDDETDMPNPNH